MKKGRSGERYILSGENASYKNFFNVLAYVSGKKVRLYKLPVSIMMMVGYGILLYSKLTGKPPLLTPEWIKKYLYDWELSCKKAQEELGYTYRPLKVGLKQTVEWINKTNL
jgi:nucleoside-diphosphate-sugar epimerase